MGANTGKNFIPSKVPSESTWLNVPLPEPHRALVGEVKADVVIVGAGLAGTLTSYLLSKAGKKVVVLDKKDIRNTTTSHTTAWMNAVVDTDLTDLIKMYGKENAKSIWASGMDAIEMIEKIV